MKKSSLCIKAILTAVKQLQGSSPFKILLPQRSYNVTFKGGMRGIEAITITKEMVFDDEPIVATDMYKSFYTRFFQKSPLIPL
jgi:hypothetical protein